MKKLTILMLILCSVTAYADDKVTALDALEAVADADIMYIVDMTGTTSKKITVLNLFDTIDTFAELDTITADETLVSEEGTPTLDALWTFALGLTITTGDPLTLGVVRWDDGSDKIDGEQVADNTIDVDSLDWGAFTHLGESGIVIDFALTADADAGNFDLDSLDRLEFFDAGLYIDGGTDGVLLVSTDGTLEIATADWDISTTGVMTNIGNITSNGTLTIVAVDGSGTISGNLFTPDAADGADIGSAALEFSDIYLAASSVIYGQNDQSNSITSSATDWIFNLDVTVGGGNINTGDIALVVGDATTDTITLLTDGTGDGEVVLRADSVGDAEIDWSGLTTSHAFTVTGAMTADSVVVGDDELIKIGGDVGFEFDTAQTHDALMLGLKVNEDNDSGNFIICEYSDIDTDFGHAKNAEPTFYIHSSDAGTTTDYIEIYHDKTDVQIASGGGDIKFVSAGGDVTFADDDVTTTGNINGAVITASTSHIGPLLDAAGDEDMDYGSADVDDHTFLTDGTGTAEIVLPAGSIDGTEILDDTVDSGDYAAASIDYEHLADDVISGAAAPAAFESGDTFLILEAGVGLREADYDDLPGVGGGMDSFIAEDGDGTEVSISDAEEWKFVEGSGIDINWTDVDPGSDGDPFDLTFTVALGTSIAAAEMADEDHGDMTWAAGSGTVQFCAMNDAATSTYYMVMSDTDGAGASATMYSDTECTYTEATGTLAATEFSGGGSGLTLASTDLSDTADILYETELDALSELITQMADVTAFITDDDMPAAGANPTIDAAGEIGRDTDAANETNDSSLRGFDNGAQFLYSKKLKTLSFTLISPDTIDAADLIPIWHNTSGMTFTITEVKVWSDDDNVNLEIEELTDMTDFTARTLCDTVVVETNGTGVFYDAGHAASDHSAIEHDHSLAVDFDTDDTPDYVQISITGWFNSAVD